MGDLTGRIMGCCRGRLLSRAFMIAAGCAILAVQTRAQWVKPDSLTSIFQLQGELNTELPRDSLGRCITIAGIANVPGGLLHEVYLQTSADFYYQSRPGYYLQIIGLILLGLILLRTVWNTSMKAKVKQKTEELEKIVAEKNILLQEIHHRVKNNLASIAGILELQAGNSNNKEVREALRESQTRIRSIVMVHDKLYRAISESTISMDVYLGELAESIRNTVATGSSDITVHVEAEEIPLDKDQSIPLGLLVNELVVNAFKHAFKNREEGTICIKLTKKDTIVRLKVEDDGVGLPEGMDTVESESLGMILVEVFSDQLHAQKKIKNTPGACFVFEFPARVGT